MGVVRVFVPILGSGAVTGKAIVGFACVRGTYCSDAGTQAGVVTGALVSLTGTNACPCDPKYYLR
jgi:hypothetical protein